VGEISLPSNESILGVRGKDAPLPAYLAAGVPVVLSSDDTGINRIDLTNEYFRAARDYGLGYRQLKAIAGNALRYSFLDEEQKRAELERFERNCAQFERAVAAARSPLENAVALIKAALTLPPGDDAPGNRLQVPPAARSHPAAGRRARDSALLPRPSRGNGARPRSPSACRAANSAPARAQLWRTNPGQARTTPGGDRARRCRRGLCAHPVPAKRRRRARARPTDDF